MIFLQLNMTAESVFRQSLSSMIAQAGCPRAEDCFIYVFLNDQDQGIDNWLTLAELKDSSIQHASITVSLLIFQENISVSFHFFHNKRFITFKL